MTAVCSICHTLILSSEAPELSPERDAANFLLLGQAAIQHLSRYHPEAVRGLLPLLSQFQALVVSFFLVDTTAGAESWTAARAALHAQLRVLLAADRLLEVRKVRPAAAGEGAN